MLLFGDKVGIGTSVSVGTKGTSAAKRVHPGLAARQHRRSVETSTEERRKEGAQPFLIVESEPLCQGRTGWAKALAPFCDWVPVGHRPARIRLGA